MIIWKKKLLCKKNGAMVKDFVFQCENERFKSSQLQLGPVRLTKLG
jgi:hypothetical protein